MFVGGEFYEDGRWITQTPVLSTDGMYYLNGGRACLMIVVKWLCANKIDHILLPSYLCPSILDILDKGGIHYSFYQVNQDLSINLVSLTRQSEGCQAVYFINYFGFLHSSKELAVFKQLQSRGVVVIEDNAQAGFSSHPTGDFVFNSLRKFTACDGGYLSSKFDLSSFVPESDDRVNRRLPLIRAYRTRLADYLFKSQGNRSELEDLFSQAESFYEQDQTILGDPLEKAKIEQQDWPAIKAVRTSNYATLADSISTIPGVNPIFPTVQEDNMPLGLPIYISGVSRDKVNDALSEASISLTIHWDALLDDPRTNHDPLVVKMAGSILTLAIDQYTSPSQLNYQARALAEIIDLLSS
jgi:hypothetical protein